MHILEKKNYGDMKKISGCQGLEERTIHRQRHFLKSSFKEMTMDFKRLKNVVGVEERDHLVVSHMFPNQGMNSQLRYMP